MADLLPFLFCQIDKYLKILCVRMNISNTNEHFFPLLYQCINYKPPIHESCEVLPGSNSKWQTHRHFCLLKLTKYLKILSVRMNISNTNEHFFPILYTALTTILQWILWNLQQSIYPAGDTIALAIYLFNILLLLSFDFLIFLNIE